MTQRRSSILAILRKSGLRSYVYVSVAIDFSGVLGGVKSLYFLESPHFPEHFGKIWSYVFVSLNP